MRIQDFCDMVKFEEIMSNWAKSTGLATVAVGADGKYIRECYNSLNSASILPEEVLKAARDVSSVTVMVMAFILVMQD